MVVASLSGNGFARGVALALLALAAGAVVARAAPAPSVDEVLGALRGMPAGYSDGLYARLAIARAEERVLAGDYGRARSLLGETAAALPRGTVARAAVEDALASVLDAEGRIEERVRALSSARDSLVEALGRSHPDAVRARLEVANAMIAASEFADSGNSMMAIARNELEQLEADIMEKAGRGSAAGNATTLTLASLDLTANDQRSAGYRLDAYLSSTERLARHSADEVSHDADARALDLHDQLDTSHACRAVAALEAARERSYSAPLRTAAAIPVPRRTTPLAGKGKGPGQFDVDPALLAAPPTPAPGKWLDVAFCVASDGGVRHPAVIRSGGGADAELLAGLAARRYQPRDGGEACLARHERLAPGSPAESGVPQQSMLSRLVDTALMDGERAASRPRLLTDG